MGVLTVIVVIAAAVVIAVIYSIAEATETAPEANVLAWLFEGFTLLAVFLALLTPYLSTCSQERQQQLHKL